MHLLLSFILGRSLGGKEGNYPYFCGRNYKRDENRAELFVGGTQYVSSSGEEPLVYGVCVGGGVGAHPEG